MRVKQGWSGEVAKNFWAKYGVELDEDDLRRLLPASANLTNIPITLAYQLLECEAEYFITAKLVANHGFEQGKTRLVELTGKRDKLLAQAKEVLGFG